MSLRSTLAELLVSAPMGRAVNLITRGRVPAGGGVWVDLSGPDVPYRIRAAVAWRRHEREEIALLRAFLPTDLDVIELGAGFGVTTAHALHRIDADARVVAVEANPALAGRLAGARGFEELRVVHAAIAYEPGATIDFLPNEHPLWGSLDPRHGSQPAIAVPRLTLSDVLEQQQVRGDYVLIADIEGREPQMVAQEAEALTRCACAFVDLQPDASGIERAISPWLALGFQLIAQRGRAVVLRNPRWDQSS